MENKDEYIVKKCSNGHGSYFFYKNGVLHRETGPAVVTKYDIDNNPNFKYEEFYQTVIVESFFPKGYSDYFLSSQPDKPMASLASRVAKYYLNGQPYSEVEFQKLKEKLDIKKELSTELLISQTNNNRKPKI